MTLIEILSAKETEVLHRLHECNHNHQAIKKLIEQWQGDVCYVVAIENLKQLNFVYALICGAEILDVKLTIRGEAYAIEHPENTPA